MNKDDVETIRERITELNRKWESNQVKIIQIRQELERLLQMDQSLRGGISELEHILRSQAPEEEEKEGDPEGEKEKPNG